MDGEPAKNNETHKGELGSEEKYEFIANTILDAFEKHFATMAKIREAMDAAAESYCQKMRELSAKIGAWNAELEGETPSPAGQADDQSANQSTTERDTERGGFSTYRELAECILAMTPEQQAMRPQVYASFLNDKRLGVVDLVETGGMATVDVGDPSDGSNESVLVKAREPEDARDFYGYEKWQVNGIVGGLPLLCLDSLDNLGVVGFRSCVDNKRNGGDVVLLADMNPFGGDGAFAYKMELDAKTGEFLFYDPEYICGEPTRVEDQLPVRRYGDGDSDLDQDADHPLE